MWFRLTAAAYIDVLVTKILPWVRKITNANYVFQQDGAPAHTAKIVQRVAGVKHELLAPMRKDFIRKVCMGFRPRLSRVIAAEGGHIE